MKRIPLFPALAVLALACSLSACDRLASTEQRLARIAEQTTRGDYGAASIELRNLVAKKPDDPRVQLAIARLNLQTGNMQGVDGALDLAGRDAASASAVAELRARARLTRGEFDAVLESLQDAQLPLSVSQRAVYRGRALLGLQRYAAARAAFESIDVAATAGDRLAARIGVAQTYGAEGLPDRALQTLDEALVKNPDSAEIGLTRAALLRMRGDQTGAEQALRGALPHAAGQLLVAQHVGLLSELAEMDLARGDLAAVDKLRAELITVAPQGAQTELLGARLQLARGDAGGAVATLQRLLARAPQMTAPRGVLIGALLAQQSVEQANQQMALLLQTQPGDARLKAAQQAIQSATAAPRDSELYWQSIALAQAQLGQIPAARAALEQAASKAPDSVPTAIARTTLEQNAGRAAVAQQIARANYAAHPADPLSANLLAELLMQQRQFAEAESLFVKLQQAHPGEKAALAVYRARRLGDLPAPAEPLQKWLDAHPADFGMRIVLAEYLQSTGQTDLAIAQFQRALATAPRNAVALNNLAGLYQAKGDPRALATGRAAFDAAPRMPQVADTYGWLLSEAGRHGEALVVLKPAMQAAPQLPEIGFHYAATLVRSGDRDGGREVLDQLLATGKSFPARAAAQQLRATL